MINEPPPGEPRRVFQPLKWSCGRHPDAQYVLGDVAILALFDGAAELRHVMNGAGTLQGIFLPLSSRVLLIGAAPGAALQEDETVNCGSAELSRDFFVSAQQTEWERRLFRRLGARAAVIDKGAGDRWIEEFLAAESEN